MPPPPRKKSKGGSSSSSKKKEGVVCLYALLKVERSASATDIRRAYYALARKCHPDKNPGDPNAEESFKSLNKAYQILKDPEKRARYDRTGCDDEETELFQDAFIIRKYDFST